MPGCQLKYAKLFSETISINFSIVIVVVVFVKKFYSDLLISFDYSLKRMLLTYIFYCIILSFSFHFASFQTRNSKRVCDILMDYSLSFSYKYLECLLICQSFRVELCFHNASTIFCSNPRNVKNKYFFDVLQVIWESRFKFIELVNYFTFNSFPSKLQCPNLLTQAYQFNFTL